MLALAAVLAAAPARAESEYEVKAAYLYKVAGLVKWPASAFANPQAPLAIGVVGREPFAVISRTLRGLEPKPGARPIEVRLLAAGDSAGLQASHIVFVGGAERIAGIAAAVRGRPVLTVGEVGEFARNGGMIGFVVREQRIKLQINNNAARQARLDIASDLLGIAEIVN